MRGKRLAIAGLVLTMVVSLAACGDDDDDDEGAVTLGGGEERPELVATNFVFEPKKFSVKQDEEVTFTIKNDSDTEHNFSVSYLDIDEDIPAGESKDITLTATEVPEGADLANLPDDTPFYYFFCKYHQGDGMQGQMLVT